MEIRCPLCLKMTEFNTKQEKYLRLQNSEKLICKKCENEIKDGLRPTWQISSNRVFPKNTRYL